MSTPRVLLVDDDIQSLESTRRILELEDYEVSTATNGEEALNCIRAVQAGQIAPFDVILSDVRMPKMSGVDFLKAHQVCGEGTPVVLMTAYGQVEEAVWAMKCGAVDFLTKPCKRQHLLDAVSSALKRRRAPKVQGESRLVGSSLALQELRKLIEKVAPTIATVLLTGESGTGKELVAREIHRKSTRGAGSFIALNCAAFPEQLIESELFGHEKGAFSGASEPKMGLFEAANGGTLFLDEIGDMPLALQAKLLRALQDREIRRVGATRGRAIDVRVISATHRDLRAEVKAGRFREDLLFRLEVITYRIPSLKERMEDVHDLVHVFLEQANIRYQKKVQGIEPAAMEILLAHDWPGNVRELMNTIERAVVFASGGTEGIGEMLTIRELPAHFSKKHAGTISVQVGTPLKEVEDLMIRRTLEMTAGDKNMTAKLLGINSRTIYRRLEKKSDASSDEASASSDGSSESVSPLADNPHEPGC